MLVKACGLQSPQEVTWASTLGYDFYGLVLEPQSPRYVANLPTLWRQLTSQQRRRTVLVARHWRHLAASAQLCSEALLQCYDAYPAEVAAARRFVPVANAQQWRRLHAAAAAAYYLYDVSLGSGEYDSLPAWCEDKPQLLVAGGLNSQRLLALAARGGGQRFFGFDLSSGLEAASGDAGRRRKDYHKMQQCLQIIRTHFSQPPI